MPDTLDLKTATFLHEALKGGIPFKEVSSDPRRYFDQLGINLADEQVRDVESLGVASDEVAAQPVSAEAQDYLKSVLSDGRYVIDWTKDPRAVARQIGHQLSPEAEAELRNIKYIPPKFNPQAGSGSAYAVISVAVAVIVASAKISGVDERIVDTSRIDKL